MTVLEASTTAEHNEAQAVTIREAAAALGWSQSKVRRALKEDPPRFRCTKGQERGAEVYRIAWDSLPSDADWQAVEKIRRGESLRRDGAGGLEAVRLEGQLGQLQRLYDTERAQRSALDEEIGALRETERRLTARAQSLEEAHQEARSLADAERDRADGLEGEVGRLRAAVKSRTWATALLALGLLGVVIASAMWR